MQEHFSRFDCNHLQIKTIQGWLILFWILVCSYLSNKSCHPKHITKNIPFTVALRYKRICSENFDFVNHLNVLKDSLLSRGYKNNYIVKAFQRVSVIDRMQALKKVEKKIVNRPVLSLQFDPRLPHVSNILYRFWKVMCQNPNLKKFFPQPPIVTWTRPKTSEKF